MDIEIKVKCSRCTTEYYMGTQTHSYTFRNERPMVGGMCPHCNNYNTAVMDARNISFYNMTRGGVTEVPYHAG